MNVETPNFSSRKVFCSIRVVVVVVVLLLLLLLLLQTVFGTLTLKEGKERGRCEIKNFDLMLPSNRRAA